MEDRKLALHNECYGCNACISSCPVSAVTKREDDKGFLYPSIDYEKCINCHKCEEVCLGVHQSHPFNEPIACFALQHKDDKVLLKSSSGGAFVAISDYILSKKGVVFGAVYDSENVRVIHSIAHNPLERDKMCGSKYVQSDMQDTLLSLKECLNNGEIVLFSGTPCQIAAVYSFLGNKVYSNLFTIDLICHGIPSPKVFRSHIKYEEKKQKSKIVDYKFRSKIFGYEHNNEAVFENKKRECSIHTKRIMKFYTMNMRDSCYECQFANSKRVGDLSIGDLWRKPKYVDLRKVSGLSTVLVNTEKGNLLLEAIKDKVELVPLKDQFNRSALSHPVEHTEKVDEFWDFFSSHSYEEVLDKYARLSVKSYIYFYLVKYLHTLCGSVGDRVIEYLQRKYAE